MKYQQKYTDTDSVQNIWHTFKHEISTKIHW